MTRQPSEGGLPRTFQAMEHVQYEPPSRGIHSPVVIGASSECIPRIRSSPETFFLFYPSALASQLGPSLTGRWFQVPAVPVAWRPAAPLSDDRGRLGATAARPTQPWRRASSMASDDDDRNLPSWLGRPSRDRQTANSPAICFAASDSRCGAEKRKPERTI